MGIKLSTGVPIKLPDDVYDCEVDSVTETVSTKFDEKPQFKFLFKIIAPDDEEADGVKIARWANRILDSDGDDVVTTRSTLYEILSALYGADALEDLDIEINTETLKGKRLRVNIVNKPNQAGEVRPTISGFLAIKKGKKAA